MSEVKTDKLSPRTDSGTTTLGDSGDTFLVNTGAKIDVNGTELILDADADTSITADTDDQIDIKIAGADDFQFTANTFTAAASSVVALDDGAVTTPALTNTGDLNTGIYFPAADTVGVTAGGTEQFRFGSNPIPGGSKNLLINGCMRAYQRGTVTDIGATNGIYVLDRWFHYIDSGPQARVTVTQAAGDGDAKAAGFASAMKVDCTTAESAVAAGELHSIAQRIEAQNVSHLGWGTSSAKTLTCSFWVKSPKSGIHCVSLSCGVNGRTRPTEYTISSADTWEHHSVTFAGDTSGTAYTNVATVGLMLTFPLVAGSNFENTADTWHATQEHCTSNQQNLLDSTSNDFYLTGVQLEIGSVATDFAHEDYGTTLRKAQRYYWPGGVGVCGAAISTSQANFGVQYPVEMRAAPTAALLDTTFYVAESGGGGMVGAPNAIYSSTIASTGCLLYVNGWSGGNALTQHRPLVIYNYGTNPFSFTAEL